MSKTKSKQINGHERERGEGKEEVEVQNGRL